MILFLENTKIANSSSVLPHVAPPRDYPLAFKVLPNFYKYLLHHDVVCPIEEPELVADIKRAIDVCKLAERELPLVANAGATLPGEFNVALSVLSKGYHASLYVGDSDWAQEVIVNSYGEEVWGGSSLDSGMQINKARIVALIGLSCYATDDVWQTILTLSKQDKSNWSRHVAVLEEHERKALEIIKIEPPSDTVRDKYAASNNMSSTRSETTGDDVSIRALVGKKVELQPIGRVYCKEWAYEDFQTYDLPESPSSKSAEPCEFVFFIESSLLSNLFPGMKFEAKICRLGIGPGACACDTCLTQTAEPHTEVHGFWQMDSVVQTCCSFYTVLKNELVPKTWSKPRFFAEEDTLAAPTAEEAMNEDVVNFGEADDDELD